MSVRAENIKTALEAFGANVIRLAQINLGSKQKARRSNGKIFYKRINNSGTLSRSLDYESNATDKSFSFAILMEDYGEWVDKGRKKGKGVPPNDLLRWVKSKPIRPRTEGGSFQKVTESRQRSISYLINRKIKERGIEPTNFLTEPFNLKFKDLPQEIVEAYALDVEDFLEFTIDQLNTKYKV